MPLQRSDQRKFTTIAPHSRQGGCTPETKTIGIPFKEQKRLPGPRNSTNLAFKLSGPHLCIRKNNLSVSIVVILVFLYSIRSLTFMGGCFL